ncbi:MAG: hypothetical protein HDS51_07960 [Barnesiella sp.]|nr:hypothetical protein [Barnesiella sp.]
MILVRRIKNTDLIEWLVVFGIYCNFYVEFCCMLCAIALSIKNNDYRTAVGKKQVLLLSYIFLYSSVSIFFYSYAYSKFIQQFVLLSAFIFGYNILFNRLKYHLDSLLGKYLTITFCVASLGLVQFVIYYFTGHNILQFVYHSDADEVFPRIIRITSILDEAGYLSILLTPAVIYAIITKQVFVKRYLAIEICFILTFGAVSYLVIILAIMFLIFRSFAKTKLIITAGAVVLVTFIAYQTASEYNSSHKTKTGVIKRFEDTFQGFMELEPNNFEVLNMSSYAFLTNIWVAIHAPNRISGTGLGTHEQNYTSTYKSSHVYYGTNSTDGYSFFNRAFSEFGIVGCVLVLMFLFKNYNRYNVLNIMCLSILFSFLLKGGHYVRYGFIFWCYLYYYSGRSKYAEHPEKIS